MNVELIQAVESDARVIHAMQVQAFQPLLDAYRDHDTNSAAESADRVVARILDPNGAYYKIVSDGELVGAIRIVVRNESHWISPLFIAPLHQGRGYARAAVRLAETRYAHCLYGPEIPA